MTTSVVDVTTISNIIENNSPTTVVVDIINTNVVVENAASIVIDANEQRFDITSSQVNNTIDVITNIVNVVDIAQVSTEVIAGNIVYKSILEEEMTYSKRVDFINENLLYKGEAAEGTLTSLAAWRIRKVTIGNDGDVEEIWASGNSNFDKVWDNRVSYTYS